MAKDYIHSFREFDFLESTNDLMAEFRKMRVPPEGTNVRRRYDSVKTLVERFPPRSSLMASLMQGILINMMQMVLSYEILGRDLDDNRELDALEDVLRMLTESPAEVSAA